MTKESFFEETREQSRAKAEIVSKYFWAWAKVIIPTARNHDNKIAYIDLFAGPGRYKDGTDSTPLLVLGKALQDKDMRNMLVTIFNDADKDHCRALEKAIGGIPGISRLKYQPQINNDEVGEQIVQTFEGMRLIPTFFFVDPWGYKGLSLRLVNSVLKNWGCDCVFFFNYNRINMGLSNDLVKDHMDALFGAERAKSLRERLQDLTPEQRELTIVEEIAEALKEMGGRYVLPFGFRNDNGKRTTHHLIFVSKNATGYKIMKEIMAGESSQNEQGVASFEYSPADARQPLLFALSRPLDELEQILLTKFAGRSVTLEQVYEEHNVGTPYIEKNYKDVLRNLEAAGKIIADKPATERRKYRGEVTVKNVLFTFPRKK